MKLDRAPRRSSTRPPLKSALLIILPLLVVSPRGVLGQEPKTLPSADEVLGRFVEATGGQEAWDAVKNRRSTGRFEMPDFNLEGSVEILQSEPNLSRTRLELTQLGTVDRGTDGSLAWEVSPDGARLMEKEERGDLILRASPRYDIRLRNNYKDVRCVDTREFEDRPVHLVTFNDRDAGSMTRSYDAESGLLVRERARVRDRGGWATVTTTFHDWAEADGLLLPHRIEQEQRGQQVVLMFDTIEHNVDLAPDAFKAPQEALALADAVAPRESEIRWLRANAVPFQTVEAGHDFDDLQPLKQMIGDARIVALGEATHGSREIFQMKHRLVEFLVEEMGFEIFAIEANMPEAYEVGEYVTRGEGDPAKLIGGMHFWTWNTEEVLDLVEWMRAYNERHADDPGRQLAFTGFDMQFPDLALQNVQGFAASADDAELLERLAPLPTPLSAILRDPTPAPFASCTASFPAELAAEKKVTFRGWIRTEDVSGWAALWWRADNDGGVAAFDNMQARAPKGDTEWQQYSIQLDVPEDVTNINFGMLLAGDGTAWFDGLEVLLDGEPFDSTGRFSFDFEQNHDGFTQASPGYEAAIDDQYAATGRASVRLQKTGVVADAAPRLSPAEVLPIVERVLERLSDRREAYLAQTDASEIDWAVQNARVVTQALRMISQVGGGVNVRDQAMAENVEWILQQNPDAKIVLWAHNGHVQNRRPWMGWYLQQRYGDHYLPIGFITAEGSYTAVGEKGLSAYPLQSPPPTSIEAFFDAAGMERAILDLRKAELEGPSSWLTTPRLVRSIGAMALEQQFTQQDVADLFELLIYIQQTTPSVSLEQTARQ